MSSPEVHRPKEVAFVCRSITTKILMMTFFFGRCWRHIEFAGRGDAHLLEQVRALYEKRGPPNWETLQTLLLQVSSPTWAALLIAMLDCLSGVYLIVTWCIDSHTGVELGVYQALGSIIPICYIYTQLIIPFGFRMPWNRIQTCFESASSWCGPGQT